MPTAKLEENINQLVDISPDVELIIVGADGTLTFGKNQFSCKNLKSGKKSIEFKVTISWIFKRLNVKPFSQIFTLLCRNLFLTSKPIQKVHQE